MKINLIAVVVLSVFILLCSINNTGRLHKMEGDIFSSSYESDIDNNAETNTEHNNYNNEKTPRSTAIAENTSENELTPERSREEDFVICDDILVGYNGFDSHVVIPDGVKEIAERAFWSVDHIEAVDIPSSVKKIGDSAFWSCAALKYVGAEEGLESIANTAFWSCPSLEDVNLPESLSSIEDASFANCPALKIHAPDGSYAEKYAVNKRITCDNSYVEYQENTDRNVIRAAQYEHSTFSEFIIEDGISSIGAEAFQYCRSLKNIHIPSSVLSIGGDAFEYCEALEFVDISEGCTEIGDGAFEYCYKLKDANIPASVQKIEKSSFAYCSEELIIHTPAGSYAEKYAIANNILYDNNIAPLS